MNYYVVSPTADGIDYQKFLPDILARHIAVMGWGKDHDLGLLFSELEIGDCIIIARGSNSNKKVFAFGVVDSPAIPSDVATQEIHLSNFVYDEKILQQLKFSSENTYGNANRIPAIYRLKNHIYADRKIMKTINRIIENQNMINFLKANKNVIFHGAPGTGKTYLAKQLANNMLATTAFVQFHPNYDYSDFVEGLRPYKNKEHSEIGFKRMDGVFKDFCKKALKSPDLNFVFIIDEINRGDVSKIFGELFFAIDPGYRGTKGCVKTQYQNLVDEEIDDSGKPDTFSEEGFYVPENVFIIGTMNDIDRSVESMDFAMRRRFAFKEISAEESMGMLSLESFKDFSEENADITFAKIDEIKRRMLSLNKAILSPEIELSSDYQLGGAYFLKLALYATDQNPFNKLWDNHLKVILKEYLRGSGEEAMKLEILYEAYNNPE